ncbi:hypothetical protein LQR31_20440 [Chromobacterium vaccinii]|uniref:Uncharacterized protein n=3 Tax=Chromobacteriaceae TaxID=1499392 RepID=A0ABV0FBR4_9NEIS|nr:MULTISPECIES: hypothetical protein [Chromobacteriaceae]ERE17994.1 hypothetical protein O166_03120 [Pseudogulbenkiania ferrooxidans EGD-HP2]MBX9296932.1 hypothetical protein [Chromobacterium vaccinii]MBX9358488.1 hypothetical protein [Chromobacterium vaccinii]MCD4486845.1 hypothetical protein [Chromobacterium vaccinii]MCD4502384.1 hypothetical protein [Chromobacterium vaccinii]
MMKSRLLFALQKPPRAASLDEPFRHGELVQLFNIARGFADAGLIRSRLP